MNRKVTFFAAVIASLSFTTTACTNNGGSSKPTSKFNFYVTLETGKTNLTQGVNDKIKITEVNAGTVARHYTYSPLGDTKNYITVHEDGSLEPFAVSETALSISVRETNSGLVRTLNTKVLKQYVNANGGYNYSSIKAEDKAEIMGQLESFAMNNFLTGITLFENGGYVKYSNRVKLPVDEYITGYGFGLLSDGYLDGSLPSEVPYPTYLQQGTSSDPLKINAWTATGSQVSDLNSYITSSYFSTRLLKKEGEKPTYEWYPCLAKDQIKVRVEDPDNPGSYITKTVNQDRPQPVYDEPNEKGLYTKWRIYLKENLKYSCSAKSALSTYNGQTIVKEDFLFPFKLLLTQASNVIRGSELATDTTYGIKGGYSFFRKTAEGGDQEFIDNTFANMSASGDLGVKVGTETVLGNGDYIEFELINPIDSFTAMYTLSSNLYSPLPQAYMEDLAAFGGETRNWVDAAELYGTFKTRNDAEKALVEQVGTSSDATRLIATRTLCVGPYNIESWVKEQQTVFKRNDAWYEVSGTRYRIPGVRLTIVQDAATNDHAIYNLFGTGKLDSTGIPTGESRDGAIQTKGDATFKLNVNSCDQDRWNYLFGTNGKITGSKQHDNDYTVNPAMSNNNFLRGLFWSINRKAFAEKRGVNPSYNYFADSYLSDPDNGVSYNSTDAHKKALASFGIDVNDPNYGYSLGKAKSYFEMAVKELKAKYADITTKGINIRIEWMYKTDEDEYGQDIANDIMTAWNQVNSGINLTITHHAGEQWEEVYNDHLMVGKFDLGFGAISGNSLNPLNFMEVLKSDNSSGFTLNWGADTGTIDPLNPIVYNDLQWTYDSLWAAADHGAIVDEDAKDVDPMKKAYLNTPTTIDGSREINDFREGARVSIPIEFVDLPVDPDTGKPSATFDINKVQLYLAGAESFTIPGSQLHVDKEVREGKEVITGLWFTVTADQVGHADTDAFIANDCDVSKLPESYLESMNGSIFSGLKLIKQIQKLSKTDPEYRTKVDQYLHEVTYQNYDMTWAAEIYFAVKIEGAMEVEQVYYAAKNESAVIPTNSRVQFAR